jgi:hypothetical protein
VLGTVTAVLPPRFPLRCHCRQSRCCRRASQRAATAEEVALPGDDIKASVFSHTEESALQEVKSKRVLNLFTAQLLGKYYLDQNFSKSKFRTIAHKNQKRIMGDTQ